MPNPTDTPVIAKPLTGPKGGKPVGIGLILIGLAAFAVSAVSAGAETLVVCVVAGIKNPLFFLCVPFGLVLFQMAARYGGRTRFACPYCGAENESTLPAGSAIDCSVCKKVMLKP